MSQLDLPLALDDYATFATFCADGNEPAVSSLRRLTDAGEGPGCWLWGAAGTGKSHLLQAVCATLSQRAAFLPLAELSVADPGILDGMEQLDVVCLDDVNAICGHDAWERSLFRFFNQAIDRGAAIVAAGSAVPSVLPFGLPDLASRLRHPAGRFDSARIPWTTPNEPTPLSACGRGIAASNCLAKRPPSYLAQAQNVATWKSLYALLDTSGLGGTVCNSRRLTVPFVRDDPGCKESAAPSTSLGLSRRGARRCVRHAVTLRQCAILASSGVHAAFARD